MRVLRTALLLLQLLLPPAVAQAATPAKATVGDAATRTSTRPLSKTTQKRLLHYVGSDDTDAFLADPLVRRPLARLMGDELSHLRRNLDVRAEASFISGMVFLDGNAPHHGGEEHGFVGIEIYSGRVCAAMFTEGRIVVYGAGSDRDALPTALRTWVLSTWAYVTLDGRAPPNVELIEAPSEP